MRWTEAWGMLIGGMKRAIRSLRRNPGFSVGVVLTLALGIGANAAMFGVLDRMLFKPPAHIMNPNGVRRVMVVRPALGKVRRGASITYPDFADIRKSGAFQDMAAFTRAGSTTLGSGPDATRVQTALATWNFLPLLGVHAERGRFFTAEDDQEDAPLTAVVSHEYWRAKMGSDPDVLGRTLELAGRRYTVIGVTPSGFTGVDLAPVDVWLPLVTTGIARFGKDWMDSRGWYWFASVARVAPEADVDPMEAKATAILVNGHSEDIERGTYAKEAHVVLDPLVLAKGPEATPEAKVAKWLGGVSLLVLLIACANVANLLLARGTRRRREVAVRLALGVGRTHLVISMVVESVLLALLGGGVAVALATWGGGILRSTLLPGVLFPGSAVSARVVGFTLVAALVAGVLAGLGPAFQATRSHLAGDLAMGAGAGAGRRSRMRSFLTVAQAALSVVLLVGAGLFVRSVQTVRNLDLGLDVDRLAIARIEFESRAMQSEAGERSFMGDGRTEEENEVYHRAVERLRTVPGVEAIAGTNSPFQWAFGADIKVPGLDSIPTLTGGGPYYLDVTPDYLHTVGLRITRGRDLQDSDDAGAALVAVVSQTMARTLWPDDDALGKCFRMEDSDDCITVVGVTEDASRGAIQEDPYMSYYRPLAQHPNQTMNALYVRTSGDPQKLSAAIAPILRQLDPRVRYANVAPLRERIDPQARSWTLGATMFTVFGLLALVVAAIGLYGVLAFDVAQRTRELGIRTALGAKRVRLLRGVVVDGVRLAVLGVVVGLGVAYFAAPRVGDLLFQVSPRDPRVFAGVGAALVVVALVASVVPGMRATRVDPMVALRTE